MRNKLKQLSEEPMITNGQVTFTPMEPYQHQQLRQDTNDHFINVAMFTTLLFLTITGDSLFVLAMYMLQNLEAWR